MIRTNKLVVAAVAMTMVLSLVVGSVAQAAALTSAQVSAIVSLLQSFGADAATVSNVTASLNGQPTTSVPSTPVVTSGYNFAKDLTVGSRGADVTALQNVVGVSPATGYFGAITKAAVIQYQVSKGITPAVGYVGAKTRAILNSSSVVVNPGTGTVVPTGTDLKVSLAATSPASSAVVGGQAAANFAEYTFTNTSATAAVVTNVTLAKIGVAADTSFKNVYLYNGATRLTDAASISSGKISFNASTGLFTVPAGTSMTISVRVDVDSGATNQLMGVSLTGVTVNGPVVSAVYPISGSQMTTFTASDIAGASLGTMSPSSDIGVNAGTLNYTVMSAPLTITNKSVYLSRAAFKVIGSVPSDALQNIALYVSGTKVATSAGIDSNGYVTFDLAAAPYKIETGLKTLEIRADVIKGSDRTFTVTIQNASDLGVIDTNYNVGITPTVNDSSTNQITVSKGTVSVSQDATLSSGNVVKGASNVPLARFNFKAYGEDMKISQLSVMTSTSTTNVALYANGAQVGSTKNNAGSNETYNLGSSLVIGAGQTVVLEVRADLKKTDGTGIATGTVVTATVTGISGNTQGSASSFLSMYPLQAQTGPQMTVVGAGLTVSKSGGYNDYSTFPNTNNVKIGSFVIQANSSEAARITGMKVTLGGSIASNLYLSNLSVAISGQNPTSPVAVLATGTENNINISQFIIPANGSVNADIYADINNTNGTTTVSSFAVTGQGESSGIDLSSSNSGQVITVNSGVLSTPKLAGSSPESQIVAGGVSNSQIAIFSATSTIGTAQITELEFNTAGSIASLTVGGTTKTVSAGATTTVTLAQPINVASGQVATNIPVYVAYSQVGGNGGVASFATSTVTLTSVKYLTGNTSTTTYMSVASNNMYPVAGFPSISVLGKDTPRTGLVSGEVKLMDVSISANTNAVTLMTLPIKVSSSGKATTTSDISVRVGNTIVATGTITLGNNDSATSSLVFFQGSEAGYLLDTVGTAKVFSVYVDASVDTSGGAGTVSLTSSLDSSSSFVWQDTQGVSGNLTGAKLINYPRASDSSTIGN